MVAITALNGALPDAALSVAAGKYRLRHDAAASYARCRAAGAPAGITTAYRTRAEQAALLALYGYPRAEYPGRSQHGEGVALDLPEPARGWFAAHGQRHGWVRTVMPSEPWHFEYVPKRDIEATAAPLTPTITEDDMPLSQADLEAIDRIVAGRIDERLRHGEPWGVQMSQLGLEAIDRVIAGRIDDRLDEIAAAVVRALPTTTTGLPSQITGTFTATV